MAVRMATFSKRLRTAIDMRGISQTELAKKTGISKSSISHYLKVIGKESKMLFMHWL